MFVLTLNRNLNYRNCFSKHTSVQHNEVKCYHEWSTVVKLYNDKGPEIRNLVTMSLQKLKLNKPVTKSLLKSLQSHFFKLTTCLTYCSESSRLKALADLNKL
jgi:hypothetical protein